VAPDALLAGLVEAGDAVALDVRLAREAQLLLHLQLDRQAVGVPAAAGADNVLPAHPPVAQHDVLHRARFEVVDAGTAVGRRRALEEDEGALAVAALQGAADRPRLAPPAPDGLFEGRKRHLRIDVCECHSVFQHQ
jgi:hypothetical protein